MDIKYNYHKKRTEKAREIWLRIATDFNAGMSASEIASRYKNPNTGKPYTRGHIYYALNKLRNESIN